MTLTYLNEDDKAYGLCRDGYFARRARCDRSRGRRLSRLRRLGPMVTFSHQYYFSGSPSISPKTTWDNLLRNFYITSAMVISNVMSRSMVRLGQDVPAELLDTIHNEISREGRDTCSLEDDEIDTIYEKTRSYMGRIFRNPRLHPQSMTSHEHNLPPSHSERQRDN